MEYVVIPVVAFIASVLTFFSGFGLGTMLTPVFMIFFPAPAAIALTGVVHFFNNIFKIVLVGANADRKVLLKFGIPAVIAAVIGAWVLSEIPDQDAIYSYTISGQYFEVMPVKLVIAILLIIFALMDLIPRFKRLEFGKDKLPLGGFLSGFFGGLSGNQGALRSAFLIKAGLSKEAFIGTAVVVSTLVDFSRIWVYAANVEESHIAEENLPLVIAGIAAAIAGAFLGNMLLKKVTIHFIQTIVAIMLIALSIALGAGVI
jgi:uncharacterized membrane protein YfcA